MEQNFKWYVISAFDCIRAKDAILQIIEQEGIKGIESVDVPLRYVNRKNRKRIVCEHPLFSRYVYIKGDLKVIRSLIDNHFQEIVGRILGLYQTDTGIKAPSVSQSEITHFFRLCNAISQVTGRNKFSFIDVPDDELYKRGQRVRVIGGPLDGYEAIIQSLGEDTTSDTSVDSHLHTRVRHFKNANLIIRLLDGTAEELQLEELAARELPKRFWGTSSRLINIHDIQLQAELHFTRDMLIDRFYAEVDDWLAINNSSDATEEERTRVVTRALFFRKQYEELNVDFLDQTPNLQLRVGLMLMLCAFFLQERNDMKFWLDYSDSLMDMVSERKGNDYRFWKFYPENIISLMHIDTNHHYKIRRVTKRQRIVEHAIYTYACSPTAQRKENLVRLLKSGADTK